MRYHAGFHGLRRSNYLGCFCRARLTLAPTNTIRLPAEPKSRDAAQRSFGGVARHAQAAVVEEAGERRPALEAVVDRLAGLALSGELGAPLAQPGLQLGDEWPAALVAQALRLAAAAGELLAHVLDHLPLARNELQRLGAPKITLFSLAN